MIVATAVFEEVQVRFTEVVKSCVSPPLKVPVALNCRVFPTATLRVGRCYCNTRQRSR